MAIQYILGYVLSQVFVIPKISMANMSFFSSGYEEPPKWSTDYVNSVAANCNGQKYNAKRAGDASIELYLGHYVTKNKPFVEDCVVVEVKERCFDCIVLKTGSVVRIYNNVSTISNISRE